MNITKALLAGFLTTAALSGLMLAKGAMGLMVDVPDRPEFARAFGIVGTPGFVLVEDGLIRQVKLGAQSERQLLKLLLEDRP